MTNKKIRAYAPGKMYLLGEYAVVYEGHPAIITGLNKGVYATVKPNEYFEVQSSKYHHHPIALEKKNQKLYTSDDRYQYVVEAMNTMMALCPQIKPFKLSIDSELDHPNQKKYGFGSSGAVIVAIIKALSIYCIRHDSILDIFKLSMYTQYKISSHSSYGDIAMSCFGGLLYYQKGNVDFLAYASVEEVIANPLEGFVFEKLPALQVAYCIGYTNQHAFSSEMVQQVQERTSEHGLDDFLSNAKHVVNQSKEAIKNQEINTFLATVDVYRHLLMELQKITNVFIETPLIKLMIQQANNTGVIAKTSGAGGGDCVLGFASTLANINQCKVAWQKQGVEIVENIEWEQVT